MIRIPSAPPEACDALACITDVPGEINRPYLCDCTRQVHAHLTDWAARLGMHTRVDAVGNLRSRLESRAKSPAGWTFATSTTTCGNGPSDLC